MGKLIAASSGNDGYLSTDEFEDVVVSLKLLVTSLQKVGTEPEFWKWAIIAAHSALQGACVCILTRTDGLGALCKQSSEKLSKKLCGETETGRHIDDPDFDWPEKRIAEFPELLNRLPGDLAVSLPGRKARRYGYDLAGDLRRLHELRCQLVHFPSVGWSIELAGLPRMLRRALELLRAIAMSSYYSRYNRFPEFGTDGLISSALEEIALLEDKQG